MTTNSKSLHVTVTAYDGDVEFPEAKYYPDFVAGRLADLYGASVEVNTGLRTQVRAYGFGADESAIEEEIASLVKVALWDDFCADR